MWGVLQECCCRDFGKIENINRGAFKHVSHGRFRMAAISRLGGGSGSFVWRLCPATLTPPSDA